MEITFIGSSAISNFHVPALRAAGFKIKECFTRKGSTSLERFSKEFGIPKSKDFEAFKETSSGADGVVIAASLDATPHLLESLASLGKPILVEKPGGRTSSEILRIAELFPSTPIHVAFNRRMYGVTQRVKELSPNTKAVAVVWPEPSKSDRAFLSNGVHMVDLLRFILGDLKIISKSSLGSDKGFLALLSSLDGKISINITAPYGSSSNAEMIFYLSDGSVVTLRPMEKLSIHKDFSVKEPTPDNLVRRYTPLIVETLDEDASEFKPGFFAQAAEFYRICQNLEPQTSPIPSLREAAKSLKLAEDLLNS